MVSQLIVITLFLTFFIQCTYGTSELNDQSGNDPSTIRNRLLTSSPSVGDNVPEEYVPYRTPHLHQENVYLYESFDDVHRFKKVWIKSEAAKGPNGEFKYDGTWDIVVTHQKIRGDYGLRMRSKSKHHAISRKLDQQFNFTGSSLIVQYDVQYRNGQECGGAYLKLLSAPSGNLSLINDQSRYSIMFGPDKCGSDHRLHFIFAHINNKTGEIREIHWKDAHTLTNLADIYNDGKWHLFRLHVSPSNRFEISMDKRVIASGSLLNDFSPPVNPSMEIDDPNDVKPEDWDEREKVPDPDAVKPDDWDNGEPKLIPDSKARIPNGWLENEPLMIPDPDAVEPADWSDDKDGSWDPPKIKNPRCASVPGCGSWSPPLIDNPRYKGEWSPPSIPNPAYQGKWMPRKIPNPDYFEDNHPYSSIGPIDAVTFELWSLSDGIVFDNILITSEMAVADSVSLATYQIKKELNDLETDNWFKRMIKQTNKKPWLWAVYIVATAIPVIFFIGFCCVTPGPSTASAKNSSSTSSTTLSSPSSSSSIFESTKTVTSSSTTCNDNFQYHHNHSPFTEGCKVNHTDQYAFRYHDAYVENSDHRSSSDNLEPTGSIRSRFVSGSKPENTPITEYCSFYNLQQHSHSHGDYPATSSSFNFKSVCMNQTIPYEEEEEDELEEEERGEEDQEDADEIVMIDNGTITSIYGEDDGDHEPDLCEPVNGNLSMETEQQVDYNAQQETFNDQGDHVDELFNQIETANKSQIDMEVEFVEDNLQESTMESNKLIDQVLPLQREYKQTLDESSVTTLNSIISDDAPTRESNGNVSENSTFTCEERETADNQEAIINGSIPADFTGPLDDSQVHVDVLDDVNEKGDDVNVLKLNEPIEEVDFECQSIRSDDRIQKTESSSVRRRRKGKNRRKEGPEGLRTESEGGVIKESSNGGGKGGSTRGPGNGKSKSRRTKARRE